MGHSSIVALAQRATIECVGLVQSATTKDHGFKCSLIFPSVASTSFDIFEEVRISMAVDLQAHLLFAVHC